MILVSSLWLVEFQYGPQSTKLKWKQKQTSCVQSFHKIMDFNLESAPLTFYAEPILPYTQLRAPQGPVKYERAPHLCQPSHTLHKVHWRQTRNEAQYKCPAELEKQHKSELWGPQSDMLSFQSLLSNFPHSTWSVGVPQSYLQIIIIPFRLCTWSICWQGTGYGVC